MAVNVPHYQQQVRWPASESFLTTQAPTLIRKEPNHRANENMGLVDYSSDSDSSVDPDHDECPPAKKRKTSPSVPASSAATATPQTQKASPTPGTTLPPLPSSFHDLYATTVRPFTADAPSLHQGRRRAIPHVAGNWPSHVYVEWRPGSADHHALASLLASLTRELTPLLDPEQRQQQQQPLTSFLTSDLAAPLPLHVSLSRPFVLRTEEKDGFLEGLVREVEGGVVRRFALGVDGLGWFRSPDSARSFLVLRVRSEAGDGGSGRRNPELATLLARSNKCVGGVGQPVLYAGVPSGGSSEEEETKGGSGEKQVGAVAGGEGPAADEAFHVSIAWSFAEPTEVIRERTAAVFAQEEFQRGIVEGISIPVDSVKVKIGNVITNIALAETGRRIGGGGGHGLFGI